MTKEEFNKRKNFIETYEEKFFRFKNKKDLRILELGIDGGGSLQLWEQYFPNASLILGVDIDLGLCRIEQNQKIRLIGGDLSKLETYDNIKMYGGFDLIIDDGSHRADAAWRSRGRAWHIAVRLAGPAPRPARRVRARHRRGFDLAL